MADLLAPPNQAANQRQLAQLLSQQAFSGSRLPVPQTTTAAIAQGLNPIALALAAKFAGERAGEAEGAQSNAILEAITTAQGAKPFVHPDTGEVAPGTRPNEVLARLLGGIPGQEEAALGLAADNLAPTDPGETFTTNFNEAGAPISQTSSTGRVSAHPNAPAAPSGPLTAIGKINFDVGQGNISTEEAESLREKAKFIAGRDGTYSVADRVVRRDDGTVLHDFSNDDDGDMLADFMAGELAALRKRDFGAKPEHVEEAFASAQAIVAKIKGAGATEGGGEGGTDEPAEPVAEPVAEAPPARSLTDTGRALAETFLDAFSPKSAGQPATAAPQVATPGGLENSAEARGIRDRFNRGELNKADAKRAFEDLGFFFE